MNPNSMNSKHCFLVDAISPEALGRIVAAAPDKETLLVINLNYHCFVGPLELSRVSTSDVVRENGEPAGLYMEGPPSALWQRHMPIPSGQRAVVQALLPSHACSSPEGIH